MGKQTSSEVEIMEFILRGQGFGINVAKVKQIIQFDAPALSEVPGCAESVMGMYLYRDTTIPLLDLGVRLGMGATDQVDKPLVLVCEFSRMVIGFYIDGVNRIHRVSWASLQPMADIMLNQGRSHILGSVTVDKREVLIVDLEHVVLGLDLTLEEFSLTHVKPEHEHDVKIILVDDSAFIRKQVLHDLAVAGYTQVETFPNGAVALEAITGYAEQAKAEGKEITDLFQLIISDIEMPQMDGLSFCERIKSDPELKKIPVIMYSSLINDEMAARCKRAGADDQLTKPEMPTLLKSLDKFLAKALKA